MSNLLPQPQIKTTEQNSEEQQEIKTTEQNSEDQQEISNGLDFEKINAKTVLSFRQNEIAAFNFIQNITGISDIACYKIIYNDTSIYFNLFFEMLVFLKDYKCNIIYVRQKKFNINVDDFFNWLNSVSK